MFSVMCLWLIGSIWGPPKPVPESLTELQCGDRGTRRNTKGDEHMHLLRRGQRVLLELLPARGHGAGESREQCKGKVTSP